MKSMSCILAHLLFSFNDSASFALRTGYSFDLLFCKSSVFITFDQSAKQFSKIEFLDIVVLLFSETLNNSVADCI